MKKLMLLGLLIMAVVIISGCVSEPVDIAVKENNSSLPQKENITITIPMNETENKTAPVIDVLSGCQGDEIIRPSESKIICNHTIRLDGVVGEPRANCEGYCTDEYGKPFCCIDPTVLTAVGSIDGSGFELKENETKTLSDGMTIFIIKIVQGATGSDDYAEFVVT